jgi:NAD(P)-dependent dehydrogenase (short-subunit alcohol dehydrogenase family)
MTDSPKSSITISSGVVIYKPRPGIGRLVGIMGGLESAARGLAVDLAPIRTNVVVLGAIQTPLLDRFANNDAAIKQFADATLLKTIGEAEEAAEAYLASMRCSYMTGSRIDCDGGALLC